MQATKQQKQLIHINAPSREIKEMLVSEITGDPEKYSCNDLSFDQANDILRHLGLNPHRKTRSQGKTVKKNGVHLTSTMRSTNTS